MRAVFELTYDTWAADGVFVTEVKRFTVDAGHNLDQIESTFTVANNLPELTIAVGLNKNPSDKNQDPHSDVIANATDGSLAQWVVQKTKGTLATAVVVPEGMSGFAEDERNFLVLARVTPGQPLRYLVGAGWSEAGEFTTKQAWLDYVASEAARARSPVRVSVAAER